MGEGGKKINNVSKGEVECKCTFRDHDENQKLQKRQVLRLRPTFVMPATVTSGQVRGCSNIGGGANEIEAVASETC